MNVSRWAMVDNHRVFNVVHWDGDITIWQPPNDVTMVELSSETFLVEIGDHFENGVFSKPLPDIDVLKATKVSSITTIANEKVLSVADESKEKQLTARATILLKTYGPEPWTNVPTNIVEEWNAGEEIWNRISAIRAAADAAIIAIMQAETHEAIYSIEPEWPE